MRCSENERLRIAARLEELLGARGWRVRETNQGARATWRWLSVTVKHKPRKSPNRPWRIRLRDGFPRTTVDEQWASDPFDVLDLVILHAKEVRRFVETESQLVRNPSKSWLAHRMWEAVRPVSTD